jgi:hypothetical protein
MDLAFSVWNATIYEGFASAPATVRLFDLNFVPGSVLGAGVNSWTYNATDNVLSIVFGQGGRFTVHEAVIIGLPGASPQEEMTLWPNPSQGQVKVQTQGSGELQVYDIQGRMLHSMAVEQGENSLDLNGSGFTQTGSGRLSPGLYMVVLVRDGKKVAVSKLMLQ